MIKKFLSFLGQHGAIILVVMVATWLRVADLDTHAIFFGDAGRDLLVAGQAVIDKELPLLGIPSSVPRFRQGPVTIWLEMVIFVFAGYSLLPFSFVFALVSIAAVIGVYELLCVFATKQQAVLAAALVAASPLAVAHGRMVYHTNPIPLATVLFLYSLVRLAKGEKYSWFWAVFAWCFLFQFELALLPLLLMIPIVIWRSRQKLSRKSIVEGGFGLVVGLAPQILYDITHGFSQLTGFAVWVAYRMVSAVSIVGDHALGPSSMLQTFAQLKLYGLRIVSVDQPVIGAIFAIILCFSAWIAWYRWRQNLLPQVVEYTWLGIGLLAAGFFVHSSPSEAYFPVFCILIPIVISFGLSQVPKSAQPIIAFAMVAWMSSMVVSISRQGWFVGRSTGFAYGPSVGGLRQTLILTRRLTDDRFQFRTLESGGAFPSYFDNLRWLAKEEGINETKDGRLVFLEPKNSQLNSYPTATKVELSTQDLYLYE